MAKCNDLNGFTFGRLEVIERAENTKAGKARWLCRCICGNLKVVTAGHLKSGKIQSCGCLKDEVTQAKADKRKDDASSTITCEHCKQIKINKQSYNKNRRFCSTDCYNKSRISEESNNNARDTFNYRVWRKDVYIKDNYTCQKCGKRGGDLNAHHIKSFSKFEELRLSVANGSTLCNKCHNEFHKLYGYTEFTSEDYYTWIL